MLTSNRTRLIVFALLCCFFVQSFISLSSKSATFDEVQYFGIGKYLLQNHKWDVMGSILHPPLSYYLNSLPLFAVQEEKSLWEYEQTDRDISFLGAVDIFRGQALLSAPWNDNDRMLIASRTITLLLAILLGFYIYRFSTVLYGEKSGIISLTLFAFSPEMLAYSGLIIPDMPLAVFSFIAVYYFWLCRENDSMRNRLLAGVFLGLALLSKFTALLLLPIFAALCAVIMATEKKNMSGTVSIVMAVAILILFAGYGFDISPFILGVQFQLEHAGIGHNSFLMGEYSTNGWWYYYIVVFLLKTPIPILVLSSLALVLYLAKHLTRRIDALFLLAPVFAIFLLFSIKHQSIGLRYILPVYPFLFVFIGSLTLYGDKMRYFVFGLTALHISASLLAAPHYLAYFNQFVGGADNGYKYLVDSNLDWGQELKGLKKYMDKQKVKRITLSYFGVDSPERYGIEYDWLPSYHLYNPKPDSEPEMPEGQLVAISATNLHGIYFDDRNTFAWLKDYEPVAKIGYSIFLYDISAERMRKKP